MNCNMNVTPLQNNFKTLNVNTFQRKFPQFVTPFLKIEKG